MAVRPVLTSLLTGIDHLNSVEARPTSQAPASQRGDLVAVIGTGPGRFSQPRDRLLSPDLFDPIPDVDPKSLNVFFIKHATVHDDVA